MHLLIVGNWGGANIGGCFDRNAVELGHQVPLAETRLAMEAPTWLRRLNWHLWGHRTTRLHQFSNELVNICCEQKPDFLLAIGLDRLQAMLQHTLKA
jgi:hypothetical protein